MLPLHEGRVSTPVIWSSVQICLHSFIPAWTPGYSQLLFRKRQEGIPWLPVHLQRPGRTEAAVVDTREPLASLISTHQARAHPIELPATITLQSPSVTELRTQSEQPNCKR